MPGGGPASGAEALPASSTTASARPHTAERGTPTAAQDRPDLACCAVGVGREHEPLSTGGTAYETPDGLELPGLTLVAGGRRA
jgi:hypothetical protein